MVRTPDLAELFARHQKAVLGFSGGKGSARRQRATVGAKVGSLGETTSILIHSYMNFAYISDEGDCDSVE